jgi:predicted metal-dependent enzyme (double-stranded beta helix superfamily)
MCEFQNAPPATGEEEFYVDTPAFKAFIAHCNEVRREEDDPRAIVAKIRPALVELMRDQTWLPNELAQPKENSGMGGGIGMWLLYRAADSGLAFSSLVVPPGAQTPVHDHLAWGLVGLYRGTQDEDVFQRRDDGSVEDVCDLDLIEANSLVPGDMYELLPENDIHRVRTTSDVTSVSLHLLGNDNGCIWRHRFHPDENRVEPFKSGWLNVPCADQAAAAD